MNFDIIFSYSDPALNGVNGIYRVENRKQKSIPADTDYEAIQAFLSEYQDSPQTLRGYTKECERLLLWAILYLNKPMSSMSRDDFGEYIKFMGNPDPIWCGKKISKKSEHWKPFIGPMSESAVKTSVASINSLLSWLVNAGYVTGNPLGLIRKKKNKNDNITVYKKVERFLDDDMWAALLYCVETLPIDTDADKYHQERMRFILTVFLLLGARISELANIKMNDFKKNVGGWFWDVNGKGDKNANVAMPKDMVDALMRWRKYLGLSALPKYNEDIPAIPFVNKFNKPLFDKEGIKPRRINQILKAFFEKAAVELSIGGQEDKAEKIKNASAHWLRHTSITQKVNAGIDRHTVQVEARHSDARTTDMYTHDDEKKRSDESQKHKIGWANK